ncbi:MAG: BlaI/MecI/CopY family transcriptional regulator [Lachnospiraceae bacterium]|nr:BlaI/MecI/CopY family transcriptional regulator [Lachnospiraceae bacterium]
MGRKPDEPLKMLGGKKNLSPMELEFMRYIWEHPDGISSEEIYEHFPQARGTKSTVLYNISQKGYVEKRQEGLHHIYTALVGRAEYEQALVRQQFLKSMGSSSLEGLVAAFCGKEKLTEKQKEKVQELLEEMERDAESGESVD